MSTRQRMLRWASAVMIALGAGHLVLLVFLAGGYLGDWVDRGLWAAVPFLGQGGAPTVESLRGVATFWSGPGGFSVPMILLGCLVWHLAGRAVAVPAGIGWAMMVWWTIGGVLLVPSPFFVGIIPSALIVLAARKPDQPTEDPNHEVG